MKKFLCLVLATALALSCIPVISVLADSVVEIFDKSGAQITEKLYITEYRSEQLYAYTPSTDEEGNVSGTEIDTSEGQTVEWSSNLPLLADVDENGKVTAYDFSKRAVIQLWIDENIMSIPLVGESTAKAIWAALDSSGIDLDNTDTDTIVKIVSAIAGDALGESLRTYLDNMNVVITATLYDSEGKVLGSDSVEVVVEKSVVASVAPTGVHITNKKKVPTLVAVGAQVQLYGACTPVRLGQDVKWSVGKNAFDTSASDYAQVSSDGLVTFLKAGEVTIRVNPESTVYAAFSDTVTFTVVEQSELPVESFEIVGSTSVGEGETTQLGIDNVVPAGAYTGDLTWESSDVSVAVIDGNGIVTGLNGGDGLTFSKTVTVTATAGGVAQTAEIKVTRPVSSSLTSIEISGSEVLGLGETQTYTSRVTPDRLNTSSSVSREWGVFDYDTGEVIWATAEAPATDGVSSVDYQGNVTAVSSGVSKLYAKASYGSGSVETYIEVTCGNAVTDFEILGTTTVKEGETTALSVNVLAPDDYEPSLLNAIKWKVEDDAIASVSSDGVVLGRDAGGRNSSKTTTVSATVSGVTRSVTITVKRGLVTLSKFTDGQVEGDDYVIRDIPNTFTMKTYPTDLKQSDVKWAVATADGSDPWKINSTLHTVSDINYNNDIASIDDNGTVSGNAAGATTLYGFARYGYQTHIVRTKEIEVIEILPDSITLKAPDKIEYIEGETELDLTGMEVYLNYTPESLSPYYSNWESYTNESLRCSVTDYTVSKLNTKILDAEQYIIVSVSRAGKTYNAVFSVTLNSKQVDTITITPPEKSVYVEGEKFDSTGLTVVANYLNAESEEVTDYKIDQDSFSMETYDVEQNVRVVYEHADRSAEATFPIIVYGKPVISVTATGTLDEWTTEDVSFALDSTHKLDGATYYWREAQSEQWNAIEGDSLTFDSDFEGTVYFKAVNSKGYESEQSEAFTVKLDKTTPTFTLSQGVTEVTNTDYTVSIDDLSYSISGIKSITVNDAGIPTDSTGFTVSANGTYTVVITANNGLYSQQSIEIGNIDKEAPGITDITLAQDPEDVPERHLDGEFGNWYSGKLVATATAEDSGVAGVDYIKYRLVSADYTPQTEWKKVTDTEKAECDANFKGYFEFVAVDKAGNESSSYYSDGFVVDRVKPVITTLNPELGEDGKEYVSGSWADDIVYLTPNADTFSGVYQYFYRVDGGEWNALTTETVRVRDDGEFVYGFKAVSYSGLESDVYDINIKVDRTVPSVRVSADGTFGQWTKDSVVFTLSTLVECASGCTYYYNDGTGWKQLDGNTLTVDECVNTNYSFKAVNGAGLESSTSDAYKVMIDNLKPSGYIVAGVTEKTDAPYEIAIVPVVGESGYVKVYFNGEDVTDTLKATVSKNGSYALTVIGSNLLSNTVMIDITNFSSVPQANFTFEKTDDGMKVVSYNGSSSNVTVPMEKDGVDVKSVSENAFLNKTTVTTVNIPDTVESIGDSCFSGCTKLTKAVIPASVTEISESAFENCENVTIYCYEGSYAQSYAESRGIPYVLLDIRPAAKTVINEDAGIIFTQQTKKNSVEEIVKVDSAYTVMAIPSVMNSGKNYYGTGSVFYFFRNGSLVYTYKVIVYGDVNGDSNVNVIDAAIAQQASVGKAELETDYLYATDFDSNGAVEASDYQQILNLVLR